MGQNAEVVRKAVAALTSGDMAGLAEMFAEDVQVIVPGNNQLSGTYKSRDEFMTVFLAKVMTLTGGQFALEPHDFADSADHAVGMYTVRGTRDGKTFEWRHVNIYHVRDGKVVELWQFPGDFEAWNASWQ